MTFFKQMMRGNWKNIVCLISWGLILIGTFRIQGFGVLVFIGLLLKWIWNKVKAIPIITIKRK
ncbi:hypothetical protein B5F53_14765 [Blautia sp. An249]|nr:hypothetical protein B5F53_14765 [Blautia sp. An249]